ncbi:hypothetical protein [Borreliella garinii]|nr:hypothetical protein [Borreliella garinii]ACL35283.1 hypothetical protein BGAFAR04_Ab0071 [Borreliella garinii Far04]WNZ67151.1 hypothetical protein PT139_04930 [Borreliella garinii]WNZ68150.1 hypothetical protein PT135_04940 [Borreliella garinii]WNZ69148.1 hypothetical protein PT138_04950 [Borreliella garinii]WNZ70148.1 hypothetical protein PT140_04925 [Borreliella garinii]
MPDSASKISSKSKTATSSSKQEKKASNAIGEAAAQGAEQM